MKVKTRFAPSPTGLLHIGGARTALYSWLFAKSQGGEFVLRIEDTDTERSTQAAIDAIMEGMTWLGFDWDEGPYYQTKRFDRYNQLIDQLLAEGKAYKCYCSKERLETLREGQMANGEKPRYDGRCRDSHEHHADDEPYVVRFRNPQEGSVVFDDHVRGRIEFANTELDDLIIRRTDGVPTYNFCVVVDDWDMQITQVVRGEDHINNTPRQINIYHALGAPVPEFAHVSMILGDDGAKLSKRHGAVGVMQYRDDGYLPEAVINFLALLGWNPGNDQEVMSMDELIKLFDLHRCSKSGAKFDYKKGIWFNHQYIQQKPNEEIAELFVPVLKEHGVEAPFEKVVTVVGMMKDRVSFVKELWETCSFFFVAPTEYDEKTVKKRWKEDSAKCMTELAEVIAGIEDFSIEGQEKVVMDWIAEKGYHTGNIMNAFRLTLVGEGKGPHMFDISWVLGKEETIARMKRAVEVLK